MSRRLRLHLSQVRGHEDPVKFVIRSWPWREDVLGLPQALKPVLRSSLRDPSQGMSLCKSKDAVEDPLVGQPPTTNCILCVYQKCTFISDGHVAELTKSC